MHIKIHDLLAEVLRSGASDLHLGVGHLPCFRIDGELHPVAGLSTLVPEDLEQAISDILQPEQMASYRQSRNTTSASPTTPLREKKPASGETASLNRAT